MTNKKKYYILYKVKRNDTNNIIDIEYLNEYTNLNDIVKDYKIHWYNVKGIVNQSYTDNITTFKDLTIIQE